MNPETKVEASAQTELTPLMRQYNELKASVPDKLMLFRMGDFYELFGDDAVQASKILGITLTSRDRNSPEPMPMAGVPHHSITTYLQRLLQAGRAVAIAEQLEDPNLVKGKSIVKRGITQILTPALNFHFEGADNQFLATVVHETIQGETRYAAVFIDAATGVSYYHLPNLGLEQVAQMCASKNVKHFLILHDYSFDSAADQKTFLDLTHYKSSHVFVEELPKNLVADSGMEAMVKSAFLMQDLSFTISKNVVRAFAFMVRIIEKNLGSQVLKQLKTPKSLENRNVMKLGPEAVLQLELFQNPNQTTEGDFSLFAFINYTKTALGARRLREWVTQPLASASAIRERQMAIKLLTSEVSGSSVLEALNKDLELIYDLERLSSKLHGGHANPRDLYSLASSLKAIETITNRLDFLDTSNSSLILDCIKALQKSSANLKPLAAKILDTFQTPAPLTLKDGGIFHAHADDELNRLRNLSQNAHSLLLALEVREKEATKIPTLKVKYNRVFGYTIEITPAYLKLVPEHYIRKQTTANAERFFTEELKKLEDEILKADSKQKELEFELFTNILDSTKGAYDDIKVVAEAISNLDALCSLSILAQEPGFIFPEISDPVDTLSSSKDVSIDGVNQSIENTLDIREGKHPILLHTMRDDLVSNSICMNKNRFAYLITGPNMGGKSTLLKQTALIVLLGQIGAPIPAERATWSVVDAIFTRIGAHDSIARGQSTFMVEMNELAIMARNATSNSLIILDEVGRGTSTFDGMSVAYSTFEWICTELKARTMFSTHYHELVEMSQDLTSSACFHMAISESSTGQLKFLYRLNEGELSQSFGIHVAELAGLPQKITDRAREVLRNLESDSPKHTLISLGNTVAPDPSKQSESAQVKKDSKVKTKESIQPSLFDYAARNQDEEWTKMKSAFEGSIKILEASLKVAEKDATEYRALRTQITATQVNSMTPIQAMNRLNEIVEKFS